MAHLCKLAVGFLVCFPLEVQGACIAQLAFQVQGNVVEQLPEYAVAEAIVVQVYLHQKCIQASENSRSQGGIRVGRWVLSGYAVLVL